MGVHVCVYVCMYIYIYVYYIIWMVRNDLPVCITHTGKSKIKLTKY